MALNSSNFPTYTKKRPLKKKRKKIKKKSGRKKTT